MSKPSLTELEHELDLLLREASRLASYDLTLEYGRARAKFDALGPRERELRAAIAAIRPSGSCR